jgi:hypothetical protein
MMLAAGAAPTVADADTLAPALPTAAPAVGPAGNAPGSDTPKIALPRSTATRLDHLPIVDIIPVFTQPLFVTNGLTNGKLTNVLKNSGTGYDPLDVGGTIKFPITPTIWASLDRLVGGTLDVPNAPVTLAPNPKTGAQPYHYNTVTRDVILNYRVDEQSGPLQFEEGLNFRHRVVGGTNTSADASSINSTEGHFGYVGVTYASPTIAWLHGSFFSLNMNLDTQAVDHHVGCGSACPKGESVINENPSQNRLWETDQYVGVTVPIDRRHGITFVAQDRFGATTFFENISAPLRFTTSQTYLLTKRFNRLFALTLRAKDQVGTAGNPYVYPNALHNGAVDVLADFKIDTNHFH